MTPRPGRILLFGLIGFGNAAAATWLAIMFLVLRHEAFARHAMAAGVLAAFCAAAPFAGSGRAPVWTRAAVTGISLLLAAGGTLVLIRAAQPGTDVEGFASLIALGWLAQGLAAVPAMRMRWRRTAR